MKRWWQSSLAVLVVMAVTACGQMPSYVELRTNFALEKIFRDGQVRPQYRYFYNGPIAMPIALLALDRAYTLDGQFWTEIELTEQQLRQWVGEFDRVRGEYDDMGDVSIHYDGLEVRNREGQPIGAVYSRYRRIHVRYGEGTVLTITAPESFGLSRFFR